MDLTVLCKVVDNYGDIGFVYRLSRNIAELYPSAHLRLVVSDLPSFAAMAPFVKTGVAEQRVNGWQIFDWNCRSVCLKEFSRNMPEVILECFQCGRPEWLDSLLFAPEQKKVVRIVNIEYLTAESWADGFHLLKSGTRSILVKKMNFMPGFTSRTGGLVLDGAFMRSRESKAWALRVLAEELSGSEEADSGAARGTAEDATATVELPAKMPILAPLADDHAFCVTVFAYERSFTHAVNALCSFMAERQRSDPQFMVHAYVAPGLSCAPFCEAWKNAGSPFPVHVLPYLSQEAWDSLLCASDFAFVRGEDSFARACLCGKPFVWHAYMQDQEVHLVKVQALLERIKPFVADGKLFSALSEYFLLYNKRFSQTQGNQDSAAQEALAERQEESLLLTLLQHYDSLCSSMEDFSASLIKNGNLTEHLMRFLKEYISAG